MIKMKKAISILLLTVILIVSCLPVGVFAKGEVFSVSAKGTTRIEAENCSDYMPVLEQYLGRNFMSFNAGQWMDYYLDVEKSGTYLLTTYVGKAPSDDKITFTASVDGTKAAAALVPDSTGYMDFAECELLEINLPKGEHTLRITVTGGGCHFDSFTLKRLEEIVSTTDFEDENGPYRENYVPSIVQAEDYDKGTFGSVSANGKNDGGKYRKDEPMDIYAIRPEGFYLALSEGEKASYTLDVESEGIFALCLTMGKGEINVFLNDNSNALKVISESEENFSDVFAGNILLTEGEHKLTIEGVREVNTLDSFRFMTALDGEYYTEKHFKTGFLEKTPEPTEVPSESPVPTATPKPTEVPTSEPEPFNDIYGHWAYGSIKEVAEKGLIKGHTDGSFRPDDSLTVIDAAVLAMRAGKISFSESYPQSTAKHFGLITDENIARSVTREEFAEMLVRALNYETGRFTGKYKQGEFKDEAEISQGRLVFVHAVRTLSLMNGDENKEFRPKDNLTRAEVSAILSRLEL